MAKDDSPKYAYLDQMSTEKLEELLRFLMPLYLEEGKYNLNIAIGCTGGRHRSVAVACALADSLEEAGIPAARSFRDLEKG